MPKLLLNFCTAAVEVKVSLNWKNVSGSYGCNLNNETVHDPSRDVKSCRF